MCHLLRREVATYSRDGPPPWTDSWRWKDPVSLLHGLTAAVLWKHAESSFEVAGPFLMTPERATSPLGVSAVIDQD